MSSRRLFIGCLIGLALVPVALMGACLALGAGILNDRDDARDAAAARADPQLQRPLVSASGRIRHVEIELRHDLLLVFKEAINNVARHSRCRRVDVRLDVEREILRLEVSDDGVGFDTARVSDGRGSGSMRDRAVRMGGRLDIDSAPGAGTTLVLTVPLR